MILTRLLPLPLLIVAACTTEGGGRLSVDRNASRSEACATICFGGYDYSLDPATALVGHGDIPGVASDAVLAFMNGKSLPTLPPTHPVRREH